MTMDVRLVMGDDVVGMSVSTQINMDVTIGVLAAPRRFPPSKDPIANAAAIKVPALVCR